MSRALRSFALLPVVGAVAVGCFDVKPPPTPPPEPAGVIAGRIDIGDGVGAYAQDRAAVERVRRELTEARRAGRPADDTRAPPIPVTGRGAHDDQPHPEALPGEAAIFFDRGRYDRETLGMALGAMLAEAGLDKLRGHVVQCVGRRFCRVQLLDDDGLIDEPRTWDAVARLAKVKADGVRVVAPNSIHRGFRVPNDPLFALQWHHEQIKLPPAWDLTIGSPDLVVAVVDSGVVHGNADLRDSIARDPQNANQFVEMDFVSVEFSGDGDGPDLDAEDPGDNAFGSDPGEDSYHGTHVSGIIAAETDNASGVAGVLWDVQLVPVRVLGLGLAGSLTDILTGLLWAIGDQDTGMPPNRRPAKVVNMSLGADTDEGTQQAWQQIVNAVLDDPERLYPQKPILVVAAGNDGKSADIVAPANIDRLITVGASRTDGLRADYSNFGSKIDFLAPGGQLSVDLNNDDNPDGVLSTWDDDVKFEQGTSMSAPHATGVAGLVASVKSALTHDQVHQLLRDTADQRFVCNEGCGVGLLDAVKALIVAGVEVEPTPRLAVDAQNVVFNTGIGRREVRVLNLGSVAASFTLRIEGPQADLFSVTPTTGTVGATGSADVVVTLDRQGSQAGAATLLVTGAGPAAGQEVFAALSFNDQPPRRLVELDVVEVGAFRRLAGGGLEPVASARATRADDFAYEITGLPAGSYEVRAVGDDNNDGIFDSQFESVGAFPLTDSPQPVDVDEDERVEDIDFGISPRFVITVDDGIGAPCADASSDTDCAGIDFAPGASCITAFPGGYCSRLCDDGLCGPFGRCETLVCGAGEPCDVCLQTCVNTSQCRDGYACEFAACVPPGF
jgi:serine protease